MLTIEELVANAHEAYERVPRPVRTAARPLTVLGSIAGKVVLGGLPHDLRLAVIMGETRHCYRPNVYEEIPRPRWYIDQAHDVSDRYANWSLTVELLAALTTAIYHIITSYPAENYTDAKIIPSLITGHLMGDGLFRLFIDAAEPGKEKREKFGMMAIEFSYRLGKTVVGFVARK